MVLAFIQVSQLERTTAKALVLCWNGREYFRSTSSGFNNHRRLNEITRSKDGDGAQQFEPEQTKLAVPQTGSARILSEKCIFEENTEDGPSRATTKFPENDRSANVLTETANASILSNLRGIQWLDRLILDGASPLAPDSVRQDARAVLKWLSVGETEAIKTKHYDQFARAIQRYITEERTPTAAPTPATAHSPNLSLNDDIRGVFNRLLDREQAAMIFDDALTWFAKVWIALIVVLNFICIIGLVASASNFRTGIAKLSEIYSPLNVWNWVAEAVALSPALGAIAWRDRRLKRPLGAALLTFKFPIQLTLLIKAKKRQIPLYRV